MEYVWNFLGYNNNEIEVEEKIKNQRHLVMQQIRTSNIKLKSVEKQRLLDKKKSRKRKRRKIIGRSYS